MMPATLWPAFFPAPKVNDMPRLRCRVLLALSALASTVLVSPALAEPGDGSEALIINGCPIWPYTRCPGADLRHADLSAKDLAGADLSGANLVRADLRAANLAGANLDGADLTAARMAKVNAPAATFRGAKLVGTDLEFARMFRTDFSRAVFLGANLEAARPMFARFVGTRFISTNLQETKFTNASLKDATMEGCVLRYTVFLDTFFDGCTGCPKDW